MYIGELKSFLNPTKLPDDRDIWSSTVDLLLTKKLFFHEHLFCFVNTLNLSPLFRSPVSFFFTATIFLEWTSWSRIGPSLLSLCRLRSCGTNYCMLVRWFLFLRAWAFSHGNKHEWLCPFELCQGSHKVGWRWDTRSNQTVARPHARLALRETELQCVRPYRRATPCPQHRKDCERGQKDWKPGEHVHVSAALM